MSKLAKRTPRFSAEHLREYPKLRGFHAPQRAHIKQPIPRATATEQDERKAA